MIATNITLRNVDFASANLTDANFSSSVLVACVFNDATLARARFSFADASGCSFSRSDLQDANLTCAVLVRATFTDANMSRAVIDSADCASADFTRCNMTGVAMGLLRVRMPRLQVDVLTFAAGFARKICRCRRERHRLGPR
jgi:uncharacterized protein YjbI with pentapeptide repeats